MTVSTNLVPLGLLHVGRAGIVTGVTGGGRLRRRLADIGIGPGAKIRVISNDFAGPVIISVGEARLAIGRGMALRIIVQET